jgi:malate permease and related proteins
VREFLTVVQAVVPVFLVVIGGWMIRRVNWLTGEADASLLRVTVNVLMPCLVFDSILGSRAFAHAGEVFLAVGTGFATVVAGLLAALAVQRFVPAQKVSTRRTFAFSVAIYNYGYLPLPLAIALFDRETVAVLFVYNVGVEIAFWGFALWLLAGAGLGTSWRRFLNPPLLTIVGTLTLNAVGGDVWVPGVVRDATHLVGQCAIPVGLLLIGAIMADHTREFASAQGGRVMLWSCLLRLGLLPLVFLWLATVLPAGVELRRVIALQAAMPAAVFSIVIARHYGGDAATALRVVLATSIVGLITIPLWLRFGIHLLGL